MGKIFRLSVIAVIALATVANGVLMTSTVGAQGTGGTWDGRGLTPQSMSYFDNGGYDSYRTFYDTKSDVIHGGIPGSVNSVDRFVDFLRNTYNTSGGHVNNSNRVGAAFIVYSLLGYNGDAANAAGGKHGVPAHFFDDLRARLNATTINWNTTVCTFGLTTMSSASASGGVVTGFDVSRDRIHFASTPSGSAGDCEAGIQITDRNGRIYRIIHSGANPAGDTRGLPPVPQWTIRAESYVKKIHPTTAPDNSETGFTNSTTPIVVQPNDKISFKHDLRAETADVTSRVYYTVRGTGFPASLGTSADPTELYHTSRAPTILRDDLFVKIGQYPGATDISGKTVRTITQEDVGGSLCQRIEYQPRSGANAEMSASTYRCADVPYNYTLTPSVGDVPSVIEPGQVVPNAATGVVTNAGPTKSYDTEVTYTRIIHKQSQSTPQNPGGGTSINGACSYYNVTTGGRCSTSAPANNVFNPNDTAVPAFSDTMPDDLEPGDRICYGLSVRGYDAATGPTKSGYRHSALSCTIVGKKPKVHVTGGDLRVGAGSATSSRVTTSVTNIGGAELPATDAELDAQIKNTQRYWYFGKGAGLYFGDSGTTTTTRTKDMTGDEGTTVATDGRGIVQFFTDGMNVYTKSGDVMTNGSGIGYSATTTQAAATFPIRGNKYVVVVSTSRTEDSSVGALRYSIVDMSSGAGSVVLKNLQFGSSADSAVGEALSVVPNGSDDGYWVIANIPGTNKMKSYPVPYNWNGSSAGSIAPVISSSGSVSGNASGGGAPGFGTINFNEGASEAVVAMTSRVRILGFDNITGRFTQRVSWSSPEGALYSADFSPSGNYVYVTSLYGPEAKAYLSRYNVASYSESVIMASKYSIASGAATGIASCNIDVYGGGGQVKRAPDGKMYVAKRGCNSLGVVNNPDTASNANIGWNRNGRSLPAGSTSSFGLPQVAAVLRINTNPPKYGSKVYGSWSEYAITASGQVRGMASAAGYAGGLTTDGGATIPNYCALSLLTFSNRPATGACLDTSMGRYALPATVRTVADMYAGQPRRTIGTSVTPSALTINGVYAPSDSRQVTVEASTLPAGRSIIIYAPNNDILIRGSQRYVETIASIEQIPQLVIIGRNITIHESAVTVSAWLVAKTAGHGNIYTCNVAQTALRTTNCDDPLTVNGPVIANSLHLRRTSGAGAGADSVRAAETFNLRSDAYLWGIQQTKAAPKVPTAKVTELPPKF